MRVLLLVALVLAGCGGPYPEATPYEFDVDGLHVRSEMPLTPAYLACHIKNSREAFSGVRPAAEFDSVVASIGTVWVHANRDILDGTAAGMTDGKDLFLVYGAKHITHELLHVDEIRRGLPRSSAMHYRWDEQGFNAADQQTNVRAYNCPDSPWVEWQP